jgi:cytochrome c oxidase subunit IV
MTFVGAKMDNTLQKSSYRMYWITWLVLLVVSVIMLVIDNVAVWRTLIIGVLLVAMLFKASLIGANFMHLRSEKKSLAVIVAAGILLTAAFMFILMAIDSARIASLSHH